MASDASRRLTYADRLTPKIYRGSKYLHEALQISAELAKKLFKTDFVSVAPITGNVAVISVFPA